MLHMQCSGTCPKKTRPPSVEGVAGRACGAKGEGVAERSGVGSDGGVGKFYAAVGEPGLVEGETFYVEIVLHGN